MNDIMRRYAVECTSYFFVEAESQKQAEEIAAGMVGGDQSQIVWQAIEVQTVDFCNVGDDDLRDASQPVVAAFLEATKDLSPEIVQAAVGRLIWITSDAEQRNVLREQRSRRSQRQ